MERNFLHHLTIFGVERRKKWDFWFENLVSEAWFYSFLDILEKD